MRTIGHLRNDRALLPAAHATTLTKRKHQLHIDEAHEAVDPITADHFVNASQTHKRRSHWYRKKQNR